MAGQYRFDGLEPLFVFLFGERCAWYFDKAGVFS